MQTQHEATAHSLYVLYRALPEEIRRLFLKELLGDQAEMVMRGAVQQTSTKPQAKPTDERFADICGLLTATQTVSLEQMEQAIRQQGQDGFDDCH